MLKHWWQSKEINKSSDKLTKMVNYGSPSKITDVKNLRQVKQKYTARKIKQIHTQRLVDQITQAELEAEIKPQLPHKLS